MKKSVNLQLVFFQSESMRREVRHSKIKILIELLSSTFIIYLTTELLGKFGPSYIAYQCMIISALINMLSWIAWILLSYQSYGKVSKFRDELSKDYEVDDDDRTILEQYQLMQYLLREQKKVELLIETLVAIQFVCIAIFIVIAPTRRMF